jgi:hypothetical protein
VSANRCLVFHGSRQDLCASNCHSATSFNGHSLVVSTLVDGITRAKFYLGQHLVYLENKAKALCDNRFKRFRRLLEIRQATLGCLLHPFLRVVVAIEQDALVLRDQGLQQFLQCGIEVLASGNRLVQRRADLVKPSVTIVFSTTFGPAQLWLEPTARNSNLLPVKAKGEVRLRSVASRGNVGREVTPTLISPPALLLLAGPFRAAR